MLEGANGFNTAWRYSRSGNSYLGNKSLIDRARPATRAISLLLSRNNTI
jgi:hypothetical protein